VATITGQSKLMSNLRSLANQPSVAELDRVGIAAMEPLRAETAALAPRLALRAGVVTRRKSANGRVSRVYWVSFKRGLAMRIAHLVELGTAPHSLAKGASRRKGLLQHVPPFHPGTRPEPFMTPAYEATKEDVITTYASGMWQAIAAVAKRLVP
jgi:hypothetical protein